MCGAFLPLFSVKNPEKDPFSLDIRRKTIGVVFYGFDMISNSLSFSIGIIVKEFCREKPCVSLVNSSLADARDALFNPLLRKHPFPTHSEWLFEFGAHQPA